MAADAAAKGETGDNFARAEELLHAGRDMDNGTVQYVFSVPDIHCGQCISTIERKLKPLDGVKLARVNLSLRRVTVQIDPDVISAVDVANTLDRLGFPAVPVDIGDLDDLSKKRGDTALLKALAVAGFASSNIMLLSVSVWSGADGATRDLFHLISALIAIPAVIYSGAVFYKSAFGALRAGRVNMDVPIALAITLATGMSIFESLTGGEEAYFEASTMLLFFLLIGRYLDHRMRERVRTAVVQLSRFSAKGANVVAANGSVGYRPLDEIVPGTIVRLHAGDRLPADGTVLKGQSDVDRSLVSGESLPVMAAPGLALESGVLNMNGVIDVKITQSPEKSFLAEVKSMMEAAENGRGAYVRMADRAARAYAPFVHTMAALAFVCWMIWTGGDWHTSLYIAIALLIITCPCALGLAVPVVHVIGASRLFEEGILMKDGSALEKMADIDHVVFDKTGTLTTGTPTIESCGIEDETETRIAHALASASNHPASRALAKLFTGKGTVELEDIREVPGSGIEAKHAGKIVRLGRPDWVAEIASETAQDTATLAFAVQGQQGRAMTLGEHLRTGAADTVTMLDRLGVPTEIVSGDARSAVSRLAQRIGIPTWFSGQKPADKIARIRHLADGGRHVLMVGDGINDAPALAAGHVSMAPASGSDVGRTAADFVFTRNDLSAVTAARDIAKRAQALVKQNFALAFAYNLIAIPIAFAGYVTPLVAAIAMSASSIVVVANSMRLTLGPVGRTTVSPKAQAEIARGQRLEPAE